jgi:hypothetical protein
MDDREKTVSVLVLVVQITLNPLIHLRMIEEFSIKGMHNFRIGEDEEKIEVLFDHLSKEKSLCCNHDLLDPVS